MTQRDDFVRCAREQVGKKYKWATAGPNTFDCSGLVAYCYEQATGGPLTRSSYEQFKLGRGVKFIDQPGDLFFWDTENNGTAGHVAIYIEHRWDGRFMVVHAMNPERGVIESRADATMGGPYLGARRLFPDEATTGTPAPYAGGNGVGQILVPQISTIVEEPAPVGESPKVKRPRRRKRRKEGRL